MKIESLDMIEDIPVGDSLHLLHQGIMKRFLVEFKVGSLGFDTKWDSRTVADINEKLLKVEVPMEIHRPVRSLDYLGY